MAIRTLHPDQVWDDRGCFIVKMENSKERHKGQPVFVSAKGSPNEFKFIIVGRLA